jgi:hypothetical protein
MQKKRKATLVVFMSTLIVLIAFVSTVPVEAGPPINCRFVLCAYPDCGPNEHTEIPTGQCCPVCVPN